MFCLFSPTYVASGGVRRPETGGEEFNNNNNDNSSIELVLIKLAYETNHQCFDQNTLAFIRVMRIISRE